VSLKASPTSQSSDTIYVANAGDARCALLHGEGLTPAGAIELGEDADNIRIDGTRIVSSSAMEAVLWPLLTRGAPEDR